MLACEKACRARDEGWWRRVVMLMREAGRRESRSSVMGRLQDWTAGSQRTVVVVAKMQMLWCAVGRMG
jgi:hypothetical protein